MDKKELFIRKLSNIILNDMGDMQINIKLKRDMEYACLHKGGNTYYIYYSNHKVDKGRYKYVKHIDDYHIPKNSFIERIEVFSILHEISHIIQMHNTSYNYDEMLKVTRNWRDTIADNNEDNIDKTYRNIPHEAFADDKAYTLYKKHKRLINYLILQIDNMKEEEEFFTITLSPGDIYFKEKMKWLTNK